MSVDPENGPHDSIPTWSQIPATAREVVVISDLGGGVLDSRRLELPPGRVSGPTPPERPVAPIPGTGIIGTWRYSLRESKGEVTLALRSIGNGAAASRREIAFRDAEGRFVRWPASWMSTASGSRIPFGNRLCPHGPWWEIEVPNRGGEPTVLRFACPTVPTTTK